MRPTAHSCLEWWDDAAVLPPAIRDLVYTHLWGQNLDFLKDTILEYQFRLRHKAYPQYRPKLPKYALPKYMGEAVADEVLLLRYKRTFAGLPIVVHVENVHEMLIRDIFDRGIIGMHFVTSIQVRWPGSKYQKGSSYSRSREGFSNLEKFNYKCLISIELVIQFYSNKVWDVVVELATKLEVFEQTFHALVAKGYPVVAKGECGNHAEKFWNPDITRYYKMSSSKWRGRLDNQLRTEIYHG